MEFKFNINNVLGDEISVIDNALRPFRNNHAGQTYKSQLCQTIDEMGAASARAQGLAGTITTASRLSHSDHHLYIMKDENGSSGEGSVVGILKVGHKKLFVYENHGKQHEMDPLCVLDFYVHESKQRHGCGKKLFEFMLKDKQIQAVHLAVDRPSSKLINFLGRHYNMKVPIPQVNNFAVFQGFFKNRPAETVNIRQRGRPPIIPHRQNSVERWQHPHQTASAGAGRSNLSSGVSLQREKEMLRNINPREAGVENGDRAGSGGRNNSASPSHRAMGAQGSMYSRHQEAPPSHDSADSTRRNRIMGIGSTPPMIRRDGPSQDYIEMRNNIGSASTYQNRRGHLVVADKRSPVKEKPGAQGDITSDQVPFKPDSSWNVFGVPSSPKHSAGGRGHQQTRLW